MRNLSARKLPYCKYLWKMLSTRSVEMPAASAILPLITRRLSFHIFYSPFLVQWPLLDDLETLIIKNAFTTAFKYRCSILNCWYRKCRILINIVQFSIDLLVYFLLQKQVSNHTVRYSILFIFVKMQVVRLSRLHFNRPSYITVKLGKVGINLFFYSVISD